MEKQIDILKKATITFDDSEEETFEAVYKSFEGFHYGILQNKSKKIFALKHGLFSSKKISLQVPYKLFKENGFIPKQKFKRLHFEDKEKAWISKPNDYEIEETINWNKLSEEDICRFRR